MHVAFVTQRGLQRLAEPLDMGPVLLGEVQIFELGIQLDKGRADPAVKTFRVIHAGIVGWQAKNIVSPRQPGVASDRTSGRSGERFRRESCYELQDSAEQPALLRAHSGRRCARSSCSGCSS